MAAEPEHREPDHLGEEDGDDDTRDHPEPGRKAGLDDEQGGGVGPRAEEHGMAERDLPAIAGEEVPGLGEHGVEEDRDHHVARIGLGDEEGKGEEDGAENAGRDPPCLPSHQKRPNRPWGRQSTTAR